jgi:hypothetical protein
MNIMTLLLISCLVPNGIVMVIIAILMIIDYKNGSPYYNKIMAYATILTMSITMSAIASNRLISSAIWEHPDKIEKVLSSTKITQNDISSFNKKSSKAVIKTNNEEISCIIEYDENIDGMFYQKQRRTWKKIYEDVDCLVIGKNIKDEFE